MIDQQHSGSAAITADGLVKRYPRDVVALDGVSFSVEAGGVFGLLGPNGAGKSTTVKILTTLSRADSGVPRVVGSTWPAIRSVRRVRSASSASGSPSTPRRPVART